MVRADCLVKHGRGYKRTRTGCTVLTSGMHGKRSTVQHADEYALQGAMAGSYRRVLLVRTLSEETLATEAPPTSGI